MRLLTLSVFALTCLVAGRLQAEQRHAAVIVSPKQKEKVDSRAELLGKVLVRGWPVVLVKADIPGGLWWVQDPAQEATPGHFKAQVRFGNERTANGSRFRVCVLMLQSKEQLESFPTGSSLAELPEGIARSAESTVVLDLDKQSEGRADVIRSHAHGQRVNRVETVTGELEADDIQPIVLVRSAEPNSLWWVQDVAESADGRFTSAAHFGNANTTDGAHFRMLVLLPKKGDKLIDELVPGTEIRELPPQMERSKEVRVIVDRRLADAGRAVDGE